VSKIIQKKAVSIACVCIDKKADDVKVLDISKVTGLADFFVICSSPSVRRAQAIADAIEESPVTKKYKVMHIEGKREGRWIILDYGNIIVHILCEEMRKFYDLDSLWGDADLVEIK
jgi:ribosome-associated protein